MAVAASLVCGATGCKDPAGKVPEPLSKSEDTVPPIPDVPVPPPDGPKLGAIADAVPVFDRPSIKGSQLGVLHAGAKVARAKEPYTQSGCPGGWYPIHPRGFVCSGQAATPDMDHPTLIAMSIQPKLDQALPYTYARVSQNTHTFRVDDSKERSVERGDKLGKSSGMAIVGSWEAQDDEGENRRLAMMTNGRFVPASDLERAEASEFEGVELGDEVELPVAYVVKRGVREWMVDGHKVEKRALLDYHRRVELTGKFRTIKGERFWESSGGTWVRHKDVTTIRRRHTFPDFAKGDQKWVDISIVTGTMVLYEGQKPVYASLVSVGHGRLGDPETTESTARGEFRVVGKHITSLGGDPEKLADGPSLHDAPWVLELETGQWLHGSYWHDRFGIEHGPGNIQLSPADALRVFSWSEPPIPGGWHGVTVGKNDPTTIVNVRK